MDLMSKLEQDSKDLGMERQGNFYTIEDGNNNIVRILTEPVAYAQYSYGKGVRPAIAYGVEKGDPRGRGTDENERKGIRYLMYVLDRNSGKVVLADFTYSIFYGLAQLQQGDYQFDKFPMPFDIRITYNKEAAPAQKYSVQPTRNEDPLSVEEDNAFGEALKRGQPADILEKMKTSQIASDKEGGVWLSPEKLQEMKDAFVEKANRELAKQAEADGESKKK